MARAAVGLHLYGVAMALSLVGLAWPTGGHAQPMRGSADVEAAESVSRLPTVVPESAPPELLDTALRLERTGGMSPFRLIRYALVVRAATPVAYQTKELAGYSEALQNMALLEWDAYRALWPQVDAALEAAAVRPATTDGPLWTLRVQRGDEERVLRASGEIATLDGPVGDAIRSVAGLVRTSTGAVRFRNVFMDPGVRGWVDIESRPIARVYIDDRDTAETTPLHTYELPAGNHRIRLVAEKEALDRTYDIKVEADVTTILNVDLY